MLTKITFNEGTKRLSLSEVTDNDKILVEIKDTIEDHEYAAFEIDKVTAIKIQQWLSIESQNFDNPSSNG